MRISPKTIFVCDFALISPLHLSHSKYVCKTAREARRTISLAGLRRRKGGHLHVNVCLTQSLMENTQRVLPASLDSNWEPNSDRLIVGQWPGKPACANSRAEERTLLAAGEKLLQHRLPPPLACLWSWVTSERWRCFYTYKNKHSSDPLREE